MSKWISDEEPDKLGDYLCLMSDGNPNCIAYSICTWLGYSGIDGVIGWSISANDKHNGMYPTHWMPLPEPPKEKK